MNNRVLSLILIAGYVDLSVRLQWKLNVNLVVVLHGR